MAYTHQWRVRFEEVDPAGIMNYPEVFDALQHGVEDLMIDVGQPVHRLVPDAGLAFPIVHAEADYSGTVEHGDLVEIEITPSIGETSMTFEGDASVDGSPVFTVVQKQVVIDFDTGESIRVPQSLRDALDPYTC